MVKRGDNNRCARGAGFFQLRNFRANPSSKVRILLPIPYSPYFYVVSKS
jgi:hypothetical protein